jgi:hypothetical protein
MKTFLEFMTEQSFSDLVASDPGFSKNMKSFVKNNEITRKIQAREPTELPKFTPSERVKPVDFTGSRYDLGNGQTVDPSKVTNKINPQREIKLRKDYRSPPAGYPDSIKDRLAAAEAGDEPPMPGSGPYKTKQSDPLKTSPAVPKTAVDKIVPKPKLRPERKPAITNTDNTKGPVAIPKPKSMDLNFTSKNKKQAVAPETNKKQTFKQAFAAAPEGSKFTWNGKTYLRKTK